MMPNLPDVTDGVETPNGGSLQRVVGMRHPFPWKARKNKTCWTINDAKGRTVVVGKCGQLRSDVVDYIIKAVEEMEHTNEQDQPRRT